MQPQEIPDDILNQGTIIEGVEETSPENEKEDYLNQGSQIYVPPVETKKDETWADYLQNFAGQLGMRIGEQAIGTYPDLMQLASIPGKVKKEALSYVTPDMFKKVGIDLGKLTQSPESMLMSKLAEVSEPITTSKMREYSKEYFGEKFEPKDAKQRIVGEISQDLTSGLMTMGLGRGLPQFLQLGNVTRIIGASLFGNSVKEIMKEFGYSDTAQETGKFTGMTFASLLNPRLLSNYIRNQYQLARASVPSSHEWNMNNVIQTLQRRINKWNNVIGSNEEIAQGRAAAAKAEEIIQRAQNNNGSTPILDIFDQRRAINQDMQTYGRFYHDLVNPLRISLNNYSKAYNPIFGQFLLNADQSYAGRAVSQRLARNIKDFTHLEPQTVVGHSLLNIMTGKAANIATLGLAFGTVKSLEMIQRAIQNPTIRNLYFRTLSQASGRNSSAFLKDFKKLENAILKENEKPSSKTKAPYKIEQNLPEESP